MTDASSNISSVKQVLEWITLYLHIATVNSPYKVTRTSLPFIFCYECVQNHFQAGIMFSYRDFKKAKHVFEAALHDP